MWLFKCKLMNIKIKDLVSKSHQSQFKCIVLTDGQWLPYWTGQTYNIFITGKFFSFFFGQWRCIQGLLRCLRGKESSSQAGDMGSIPGQGRSPGEGNSNPPQYSCLGNPSVHGVLVCYMRSKRVRHNLATKQQQQHSTQSLRGSLPEEHH